jgi:parvulin-like peptidyl-prolyl isomerase
MPRLKDTQTRLSPRALAVAACLTAAALTALPLRAARAGAETDDDPVVTEVNGTPIHRSAVREVVKSVVAASRNLPSSGEIDNLTQDALDSLIDLELLYQAALARKIQVSNDEVEAQIDLIRKKFANRDDFVAALSRSSLTESRLREETRKTLLVDRLLETVVWRDIEITDADITAFYEQNRAALLDPDKLRVRQILVGVPPETSPTTREDALVKAKNIRAQLVAGADFAQMAREQSDDRESGPLGGDLGPLRGETQDPVMKAARELKPGEISEIIETSAGYHIIQVTERAEGTSHEPDQRIRSRIAQVLLSEERQQRQAKFVAQLRKNAQIKYLGPTPRADSDATEELHPADQPEADPNQGS